VLPSSYRGVVVPQWDAIVMRLLEKARDDRYSTARELFEDLQNIGGNESQRVLSDENSNDACFDVFNTSIGMASKRTENVAAVSINNSNRSRYRLLAYCAAGVLFLALGSAIFKSSQTSRDSQTIAINTPTPNLQVTPPKPKTLKAKAPQESPRQITSRQKDPATYVWVRESTQSQRRADP